MSEDQISEVLSLLDEGEVIKINDRPTSQKEQNIELRREINTALEKLRLNNAHNLRNTIQYAANHFKSIGDKVTKQTEMLEIVIEAAKDRKKWHKRLRAEITITLIKYGIASSLLVVGAGVASIILGIKAG